MKAAKLCVSIGGLLSLGACAITSAPSVSKQTSLDKNTEQLVGEFGYWKRDCSARHFDIDIVRYPEKGELRFEVGSLVIPDEPVVGSSGNCVGRSVVSKRLVYVPDNNFVGSDSVKYEVSSSMFMAKKLYEVNIEVD